MLKITIPGIEQWDEIHEEFISTKDQTLQLEHSLVSISKWESKWCKSFVSTRDMTQEQAIDYIKCMTITQNVDPEVYNGITSALVETVWKYINAPMTATVINEDTKGKKNSETITSELIYYWMFSLGIPIECQKWHLNRLLTLIRVFNIKNSPPKKRSLKEIMSRNHALNAARKQQLNTRG